MIRLLISGAAVALLAGCSGSSDGIEPGEWEMTMTVNEIDLPNADEAVRAQMASQTPPPQTTTVCVTPEQARDPDGGMFAPQGNENCEYANFDMSGGNMELEATCEGAGMPGEMHMTINGTYDRTSFTTDMEMEVEAPAPVGAMTMSGTMTGEHKSDEC